MLLLGSRKLQATSSWVFPCVSVGYIIWSFLGDLKSIMSFEVVAPQTVCVVFEVNTHVVAPQVVSVVAPQAVSASQSMSHRAISWEFFLCVPAGYIVWSFVGDFKSIKSFEVVVQGARDPVYVDSRIEAAISMCQVRARLRV